MLCVSWKSPFIFQRSQYRKHKWELDVKEKEDSQGSNNIILSFTELRMNEMSILASQEEPCDFLCIKLFKVIYNH